MKKRLWILLLIICCGVSTLPPMPPIPSAPLYSPKDLEFRQSLAKVTTSTVIAPALSPAPPSGFAITNLTVSNGQALVGWQGGVNPVQLERSADLLTWTNEGPPTIRKTRSLSVATAFFRVRQAIPLLSVQTNGQGLLWLTPEIDMPDTYDHFILESSPSGVEANSLSNGTLNAPIATVATLTNKTTTTADHVVPAIGARVTVAVLDSTWMNVGDYVNEPAKGIYLVTSKPNSTSVVLQYDPINAQAPNTSHAGETALSGIQVVPGSFADLAAPDPTLYYRLSGITANNVTVPFDVVKMSVIQPGSAFWAKSFGAGGSGNHCYSIKTDSQKNAIFTGGANTAIDLGGGQHGDFGPNRVFLAKYSQNGSWMWDHVFGPVSAAGLGQLVAVDSADNIILGGYWGSTGTGAAATIGSVNFPALTNGNQLFVAKFLPDGTPVWAVPLYGTANNSSLDIIFGLGTFSNGDIAVCGYAVVFGATRMFLIRLSGADGSVIWTNTYGSGSDAPSGLCVDPSDNVIMTGVTGGSSVGGSTLSAGIFAARYNSSGVHQWSHSYGASGNTIAAPAANGSLIALTGGFQGSLTIGSTTITSGSAASIFVATLNPDGSAAGLNKKCGVAQTFASSATGIAFGPDGNMVCTGYSLSYNGASTMDFGNGPIPLVGSTGGYDIYLAKLTPSGNQIWAECLCGTGGDYPYALAIDQENGVLIGGEFTSADLTMGLPTPLSRQGSSKTIFAAKFNP